MSELLNMGYDVEEILSKNESMREQVLSLRKWTQTQNTVPKTLTDGQLTPFLMACKCNEKATRKCLQEYYMCRKNGPELFNGRNATRPDIRQQLKTLHFIVLPVDTDSGQRVIVHRLKETNPSLYHMDVAMKVLFMTVDAALHRGPPNSLIILFDMEGVGFGHLARIQLGALRKFFNYLQDGLPVCLSSIHVLNTVPFIDKILTIIKPFMRKELFNMLHMHPTGMDMNEFHEKYLPRKCLPSDFGGNLPALDELHDNQCDELLKLASFFLAEEEQRGVKQSDVKESKPRFNALDID